MDVNLYTKRAIGGVRFKHGTCIPVYVELFIPRPVDPWKAFEEAIEQLRLKVAGLCLNAVIAVELQLDPFAESEGVSGVYAKASGSAAYLEHMDGVSPLPEGDL